MAALQVYGEIWTTIWFFILEIFQEKLINIFQKDATKTQFLAHKWADSTELIFLQSKKHLNANHLTTQFLW